MDSTFELDQPALRKNLHDVFALRYPDLDARRDSLATASGFDAGIWRSLAQLDVLGSRRSGEPVPAGAGPTEAAIVAEEIGRVLAPEPYVAMAVLTGALITGAAGAPQRRELLTSLGQGTLLPVFAHSEADATGDPGSRASRRGHGWSVSGTKESVVYGAESSLLIVSAHTDSDGTGLFLIEPDQRAVEIDGYTLLDGSRAARLILDRAAATPLGTPEHDHSATIATALARARIAYCHEAVGAMARALQLIVDHSTGERRKGAALTYDEAAGAGVADWYLAIEFARRSAPWATTTLLDDPDRAIDAAARATRRTDTARWIGHDAMTRPGPAARDSIGHYARRLSVIGHLLEEHCPYLRSPTNASTPHHRCDTL
ncbi:acyl-CoA dehydrogenase family protein [Nocardia sp. bgisy134]|uniref:acyl-CoA dehydrogenase family protein n=1 Tax=unclassified Nocardia TaxID=2637762 RepID=UPI003D71C1F0